MNPQTTDLREDTIYEPVNNHVFEPEERLAIHSLTPRKDGRIDVILSLFKEGGQEAMARRSFTYEPTTEWGWRPVAYVIEEVPA